MYALTPRPAEGNAYAMKIGRNPVASGNGRALVPHARHENGNWRNTADRALQGDVIAGGPGARRYRARARQSGILPCFFGGVLSRLVSSVARPLINFARVWLGRMISSMKPRCAATYG